jgi:hypothetical protein
MSLPLLVGVVLALAVGVFATVLGMDRERGFYATILMVIAALYSLFATMAGATHALLVEAVVGAAFVALAVLGYRRSLWWVALALLAHGLFDYLRGPYIANPGVPSFWPEFCMAYDVVAAAYLAVLLRLGHVRTRPPHGSHL